MGELFYLAQDDSCHWYIVPFDRRSEWDAWREIPEDDERSWEPPAFARRVNGSASNVLFTNPTIETSAHA